MKFYKILLLFLVVGIQSNAQITNGYKLSWFDEFNGTALDETLWYYRTDAKHKSVQLPENVSVANGFLKLDLTVLEAPIQGKNYGGAGIVSKQKNNYGYYEVTAKMGDRVNDDGDGLTDEGWHHSFWAMSATPTDGSVNTTYPGERRTEIDCYEYGDNYTIDNTATFTQHIIVWKPDGKEWGRLPDPPADKVSLSGFDTNQWHTYGFKWTEERVIFYVDNEISRIAEYPVEDFEHDEINVWLTAMSANWTNSDPEKSEAMYDYFRFYEVDQDNPPVKPLTVSNFTVISNGLIVELNWDEDIEENIYHHYVYRSTEENGTYQLLGTVNGNQYKDSDITSGATYYYQIKSLDKVGEVSDFSEKKSVLVNETSKTNYALSGSVSVDSEYSASYPKANAIDGDRDTNEGRWLSANSAFPHWIEIDFGQDRTIDFFRFFTGYNGYNKPVKSFQFQEWNNDQWVDILNLTDNDAPAYASSFTPVTTSKVRLYATEASDNSNILRLYEIEVYGESSLGINQTDLNNLVTVYPNPVDGDVLNIKGAEHILDVAIYNVLGVKFNVDFKDGLIDVSQLKQGLYVLNLNNQTAIKFLKK